MKRCIALLTANIKGDCRLPCSHGKSNFDLQNAKKKIRDAGLKVTKARLHVFRKLVSLDEPATAEDLYTKVSPENGDNECDLVTIYRILAKFEEAKIAIRCDFGDGVLRYEYYDEKNLHHHIICRKCKKVESVAGIPVESFNLSFMSDFKDITHRLEFFGTCPSCASL